MESFVKIPTGKEGFAYVNPRHVVMVEPYKEKEATVYLDSGSERILCVPIPCEEVIAILQGGRPGPSREAPLY